ncbi:MAG TPA: AAA family ATPase [Gemmatimonadaceae bacterium]|jgi:DNA-binding SARP family transcriptional activator
MSLDDSSATPIAIRPLALRTLGHVALVARNADGVDVPISISGKQLAVVIFLACSPNRSASRETLIEYFGPNHNENERRGDDARSGDALRDLMRQLRAKLGREALGAPRADPVRLSLPLICDRDTLLSAWERADYADVVRVYDGDFLPRLESAAGNRFALWIEAERADLRRRFAYAARHDITNDLSRIDDPVAAERALRSSRRLRDHDLMMQDAWQLLLRCLVATGRHGEAALEAERFRAMLATNALVPEPASSAVLAIAGADGGRRGNGGHGPRASDASHALSHTVGREDDIAMVLTAWDRARRGTLVRVEIVAPAGYGKSTLLAELRQRLRARPGHLGGTRVVEARAAFSARDVEFALAGELAGLVASRPGGIGVAESVAHTLVALNPILAATYRSVLPERSNGAPLTVRRVAAALQELIAAVALEEPLVIFVDDLHWCDGPSRDVLADALASCVDLALLIVTASRDSIGSFATSAEDIRIDLEVLDTAAVVDLLERMARLPAQLWAQQLLQAIIASTAGSPMLVAETLQMIREQSLIEIHEGEWITRDADTLIATLVAGGATQRRLQRLTSAERRVLLLITVAAAPLSSLVLRSAAQLAAGEFNAALTTLERRGWVARRGEDWIVAHDEHANTICNMSTDIELRDAGVSVAEAILAHSARDALDLRLAGALLARAGMSAALTNAFLQFVRLMQERSDERPLLALASEFLGATSADEVLVTGLVRSLPLRVRFARFMPRNTAVALRIAGVVLAASALAGMLMFRPRPDEPDAVVAVGRIASDRSIVDLFAVPIYAGDWGQARGVDVKMKGTPRWRRAIGGVGGIDPRPDGRGWTAGAAVADSGVLDVFDYAFDGSTRRLTFAKSDDYQPSWAPDNTAFAFVTERWSTHGHYDLAVYDTLTRNVRQLTSGDDIDWEPRWSPDGSRIAFVRQSAVDHHDSLCIIDVDGTHLHCLRRDDNDGMRLARWFDAHRILLTRVVNERPQLERIDVDRDSTDLIDERGAGAGISPDGKFALCACPRPGYTDGSWIAYPIDRPDAFVVLRVPAQLRDSVAEWQWSPRRRAPFVDSLAIDFGLGSPVVGIVHQLTARGLTTAHQVTAVGSLRWHSEDTTVATIDSVGRLTPRRVGQLTIVATAGGWRTTRVRIDVVAPSTRLLMDEDWSRGLESRWRTFGVPRPRIVTGGGVFERAFLNNGDGAFFSGAYTASSFDTRGGLWVEVEASTPITASDGQDFVVSLFQMGDSVAWAKWDHATGDGPPGVSNPNWSVRFPTGTTRAHFGEQLSVLAPGGVTLDAPTSMYTGRPFRMVLQVFPDGRCGVALDGKVVWSGGMFLERRVRVTLAGNTVNTSLLVGRVRVGQGIAAGVQWRPGRQRY